MSGRKRKTMWSKAKRTSVARRALNIAKRVARTTRPEIKGAYLSFIPAGGVGVAINQWSSLPATYSLLDMITQGVGLNQRIGMKIKLVSLDIRFEVIVNTSAFEWKKFNDIMWIIIGTKNDNILPAVGSIWEDPARASLSHRVDRTDTDWSEAYTILYKRKKRMVQPFQTTPALPDWTITGGIGVWTVRKKFKLNWDVVFDGSTATSYNTGGLWFMIAGDTPFGIPSRMFDPASAILHNFAYKLHFTDV